MLYNQAKGKSHMPLTPQEPKDDPRVQAIGQAAKELVEQRDRWLNATPSALAGTSPKYDNKNAGEICMDWRHGSRVFG